MAVIARMEGMKTLRVPAVLRVDELLRGSHVLVELNGGRVHGIAGAAIHEAGYEEPRVYVSARGLDDPSVAVSAAFRLSLLEPCECGEGPDRTWEVVDV
jgi:hypothetical protein